MPAFCAFSGRLPVWRGWEWRRGLGGWGSSRAEDGIQSVGLVHVPAAKLCLAQFQDHVRVTLGSDTSGGGIGTGEGVQVCQGGWEGVETSPLHHMAPVGHWRCVCR